MSEPDLITIEFFCKVMLGVTRLWYYKHVDDPGVPQRVYVGAAPRLVRSECEAYVEALKQQRGPKAPLPRKGGRPRKVITPPASPATRP